MSNVIEFQPYLDKDRANKNISVEQYFYFDTDKEEWAAMINGLDTHRSKDFAELMHMCGWQNFTEEVFDEDENFDFGYELCE